MSQPVYSEEQVVYLMKVARLNDSFGATDLEMLELAGLVEDHDEDWPKVRRCGQ